MRFDRCPADGDLPERWILEGADVQATVVPEAGMNLVSLAVAGVERLRMPEPLGSFMATARTGGVPLLHPWANRLRGDRYGFEGIEVDLGGFDGLKRDGAGLPMHGLLLRHGGWRIETTAGERGGVVEGRLGWTDETPGFEAHPFPHDLAIRWEIGQGEGVTARCTTIVEAGGIDVPLGTGWHPYLRPAAGVDRAAIEVRGPEMRRAELDGSGLPVLDPDGQPRLAPPSSIDGPLGDRTFDDLHRPVGRGWSASVRCGDDEVTLRADEHWSWLQVYAPAGSDYVCFEPMLAPTAALTDGSAAVVPAGGRLEATFEIHVHVEEER